MYDSLVNKTLKIRKEKVLKIRKMTQVFLERTIPLSSTLTNIPTSIKYYWRVTERMRSSHSYNEDSTEIDGN